ncbi:hypothetical protein BgiBS90_035022 [Biomphalaria glabrata]|nr:hypothetical protein BgiBS90_035022 [Biomphalaria glabrata]
MEENIKEPETEKIAPEDPDIVISQSLSGKRSHEGNEEPLMKVARTDSVISARSVEISALSKENKNLEQRLLEMEKQKDENMYELRALRTLSAQSYLDKVSHYPF